jgi:prevent-host-death family protein
MSRNEMPLREARAQIGHLVDRAEHHGETTIITRHGRPAAMLVPHVEESAVITTYTHPDFPRIALRAEDMGDGSWRRTLLIDGEVAHTTVRPETIPNRHTAQIQASQAGFVLHASCSAVGPNAGQAAEARDALGEHKDDVDELASRIALGRAYAMEEAATPEPTYTAAIGLASSVVAGDHCDLSIAENDVVGYRDDENGGEVPEYAMGNKVVLDPIETAVRTDDEDVAGKVYAAADEVLAANGWRRTGDWDDAAGDAAYAPVERA